MTKPKEPACRGKSKFRNKPTNFDGVHFDSIAEVARYVQLKKMQRQGRVADLATHQRFPLIVNGNKVGVYEADFVYTRLGSRIVEDVKGHKTPTYLLKKALFKVLYPEHVFMELPAKDFAKAGSLIVLQIGYGCTAEQIIAAEPLPGRDVDHAPQIHGL